MGSVAAEASDVYCCIWNANSNPLILGNNQIVLKAPNSHKQLSHVVLLHNI